MGPSMILECLQSYIETRWFPFKLEKGHLFQRFSKSTKVMLSSLPPTGSRVQQSALISGKSLGLTLKPDLLPIIRINCLYFFITYI